MVLFPSAFSWSRLISWMRVLLAAAALAGFYMAPARTTPLLYGILGVFVLYALGTAIRNRSFKNGAFSLLGLFADTVFFLILGSFGEEHLLWLTSVFYLLLLAEAITFYAAVEVFMVVSVCAIFCAVVPYASIAALQRTVVIAGALACSSALKKQRLDARAAKLFMELKEARQAIEKAVENERQRIASDFHDGPLQSFISLQMRLDILRKLLERDFASGLEDLKQLQALAQFRERKRQRLDTLMIDRARDLTRLREKRLDMTHPATPFLAGRAF